MEQQAPEKVPGKVTLEEVLGNQGTLRVTATGIGYIKRRDGSIVPFEMKGELHGDNSHAE